MKSVNIQEAKTTLSRLVEEASGGVEVTIARAGRPVARLVPIGKGQRKRMFGVLRDKIWIADDFDAPLPDEILRGFEGERD